MSESMDPLSDADNPRSVRHYEAPLPVRCHACTAREIRRQVYADPEKNVTAPNALYFPVRAVDGPRISFPD